MISNTLYQPHTHTILPLENMGLLCVAGMDAKKFLQGQLTCHLEDICADHACFGAQCNPQGRIIHFFRIFYHEDCYYLQMPIAIIPIALAALKKYAIFFKVTLSDVSDTFFINPHIIALKTWKPIHFQQGIPTIYPETSEKFLPHDMGLPQLNAVSFNKGCYTGQEIIARMHYRGKPKYQLFEASVDTSTPLIRGTDIYDSQNTVGMLVDYYKTEYNSYRLQIMATQADELFLDANRQCVISR